MKVTGVSRPAIVSITYLLIQRHLSSLPTQQKGVESQPTQTANFSETFSSEQFSNVQSVLDKEGARTSLRGFSMAIGKTSLNLS